MNAGKTPALHQMKERSQAQTNASIHHDPINQHSSPSTRRFNRKSSNTKKARLDKITIDHRFKIQIKTATDREMKKPHESQGSIFSSS